jgi:hypothetical protein
MKNKGYSLIIVESFIPDNLSDRHGSIHIRPVTDQQEFKKTLFVQCSKVLSEDYPLGTKFRIQAKLTNREGSPFITSHYSWPFEVLT